MLRKSFITFAAAVALGCVPVATNALAAGHRGGHASAAHASIGHASAGRATAGHAMAARRGGGRYAGRGYRGGPVYDSYGGGYGECSSYGYGYGYDSGYGGCRGYGIPLIGGIIGGILNR